MWWTNSEIYWRTRKGRDIWISCLLVSWLEIWTVYFKSIHSVVQNKKKSSKSESEDEDKDEEYEVNDRLWNECLLVMKKLLRIFD